jgi:hypothetical protein
MTTIGNEFDAIFKPQWLAVVHGVEALATGLEGEAVATIKTDLQTAQGQLSTALTAAATQVTAAQSQIDTTVNPLVNQALTAAGTALSVAYPPFAPLIGASEGEVENLADGGTDAILVALIQKAAGFLSAAGKTVAAVNLSNLAGAS